MKAFLTLVALLSLAVSGCMSTGPTPEQLAIRAEMQQAVQDCHTKFALRVSRAHCLNDVDEKYARATYRYPDLLDVLEATRLSLAAKVDAGQMTGADADLEFAKTKADLVSTEKSRNNQTQMVQLQRAAVINSSRPVTCTTFGTTTNCF
jgi:hypothetical protein